MTPDGNLVDGDAVVVCGLARAAGESCAGLLVPAIDVVDSQASALGEESVASVLGAIGRAPGADGGTWVTTDGRWSNGVLSGAWHKDHAGYIGEGARKTARRTRIEQLERELDAERAAIEGLDADLGAYRVALAALWPAAEAAHTAIRAAADAEAELADSRQLLIEASERAAEAREAAGAAAATYQELLATVGTAVEELQRRLAEVTGALGRLRTAERDARQREQGALEARGKADGKQGELRTQVEDAARLRDDAVRDFQAFAATGLLRVAVASLEIPGTDQPS